MSKVIEKNETSEDGGISKKGLKPGTVGVLGAVVIGLSCCAPAYTLTASIGLAAAEVGEQLPVVFILGFIPMLLIAFGYKALDKAMPDAGTSFTWGVRAFGPYYGWMAGWGLIAATVLVLSNLAGVAVDFLYDALAIMFNDPAVADLADNVLVNILTCTAFMGIATLISYFGMQSSKVFQYITVVVQMAVLVWFIIAAFTGGSVNEVALEVKASWFNPANIGSAEALAAGISVTIFVYWGWDTVLTLNEEAKENKGKGTTTGKATTILVIILLGLYVTTATATLSFAGLGKDGYGLNAEAVQENVFSALADPVMGSAAIFMAFAVMLSSAASIQSTAISPARTLLSMGHYKAMPSFLSAVSKKYGTPTWALFVSSGVATAFYAIMRSISEDALWDTILSLGMMVCFYYGLTALSSSWYFRRVAVKTTSKLFTHIILPFIGGILLLATFVKTLYDSMDPDYGSGNTIPGTDIGIVFGLGVLVFIIGIVMMIIMRVVAPAFFKGETLRKGVAEESEL